MGMTVIEKILANKSNREKVAPGDNIWVNVDKLLTHDVTGPGTIEIFKANFGEDAKVFDKEKVIAIPDHYIFTEDKHAQRNIKFLTEFAKEQDLKYYYEPFTSKYKGVCHVAMAEEGHVAPGEILFGTDSHTCTAGAFGQFASGIGNTDAAYILGTGQLWVKVPETTRFTFHGKFPKYIMGKDIALQTIGDVGFDGATYGCLQYDGEAINDFNVDERMTICNMAIEAGGKCGIIEPDEVIFDFLEKKGVARDSYTAFYSDKDAKYKKELVYKAEDLVPVVAKPYSPGNVEPAANLSDTVITRAYIGSCTGGKLTDFLAAAEILKGQKVEVETFIVPATTDIDKAFNEVKIDGKTLREIFVEAGCKVGKPSCAACLGGPMDTFGRTHGDEVVISTTNRNFPGRMGSMQSKVYLASPYTAAASALTGFVTDPRKFLK